MTKFSIILVVCCLLLVGYSVSADEISQQDDFTYLFHLYYDNGQLFADRDFEFKYDVIPESFTPEQYNTQFPYKGEIINLKNEVASEFRFDPKRGNPDFTEGKISVKAPYAADGLKAVFYNAQGRSMLTIFVSESSFCNDDGICNFERGEDRRTCPNDCTGVTPPPPPQVQESGMSDAVLPIIIILILGLLGAGGWYWWRKRTKHVEENQFTGNLK